MCPLQGHCAHVMVCSRAYKTYFLVFSVAEIVSKLDPEGAGIILMSRFLDEFYSEQVSSRMLFRRAHDAR